MSMFNANAKEFKPADPKWKGIAEATVARIEFAENYRKHEGSRSSLIDGESFRAANGEELAVFPIVESKPKKGLKLFDPSDSARTGFFYIVERDCRNDNSDFKTFMCGKCLTYNVDSVCDRCVSIVGSFVCSLIQCENFNGPELWRNCIEYVNMQKDYGYYKWLVGWLDSKRELYLTAAMNWNGKSLFQSEIIKNISFGSICIKCKTRTCKCKLDDFDCSEQDSDLDF